MLCFQKVFSFRCLLPNRKVALLCLICQLLKEDHSCAKVIRFSSIRIKTVWMQCWFNWQMRCSALQRVGIKRKKICNNESFLQNNSHKIRCNKQKLTSCRGMVPRCRAMQHWRGMVPTQQCTGRVSDAFVSPFCFTLLENTIASPISRHSSCQYWKAFHLL